MVYIHQIRPLKSTLRVDSLSNQVTNKKESQKRSSCHKGCTCVCVCLENIREARHHLLIKIKFLHKY